MKKILYSCTPLWRYTHTHVHMNISLSRYVSRLKCKKGPHWELNPGPLAIKARFSQSENHTTRPYGRDESLASIRTTSRTSHDEHGKTFTSSLKAKKGPHWELNPGPLAIKARFSQSENHTTRPYGRNLIAAAKTYVCKYLDYKVSCRHRAGFMQSSRVKISLHSIE